jgi:twitching motility protein PilT
MESSGLAPLGEEKVREMIYERLSPEQRTRFETDHELNLSYTASSATRIRQNIFNQRGSIATACRLIPLEVPTLEDLNIDSKAVLTLAKAHQGLVLVTGPTGSGKSTTLAAIINLINSTRPVNIITVEDPIEYVHKDKSAFVSQREVGVDTKSFHEALKQMLRQAPDVILVGELRDLATLDVALQAAETGHLVFATLHTSSASETLDRISNMYAPHERAMLWLRLSVGLRGVISQKLVVKADGSGRKVAMEVMVATPTISKQLEDGRSEDLYNAMRQDGEERYWGMQTMNQCLTQYHADGIITEEEALRNCGNLAEIKQMLRKTSQESGRVPVAA